MRRLLSIHTASQLARIFSPDFVEIEELILLPNEANNFRHNLKSFNDKSSFEAFQNHTHMIDLFKHHAYREEADEEGVFFLDKSDPDFQELCFVGKFMAKAWLEKLKEQFSNYRFRVHYTEKDDPVVRFHRVRPGEPFWLNESQHARDITSGKIIVYDTGKD